MTNEAAARKLFEVYCSEGVRPMMYNLTQTASGEYVSQFTEWAWKLYWKGMNDALEAAEQQMELEAQGTNRFDCAETNDGAAWDTHYLDCGQDDGYSDI
jgi:hypothetical protein